MSQKVLVVKVNADGIRAKIYGKDYAWNKAKNQFFIDSNGKWTAAEIPAFHQSVLKDRHGDYMAKEKRRTFIDNNPYYLSCKQRQARALQNSGRIVGGC